MANQSHQNDFYQMNAQKHPTEEGTRRTVELFSLSSIFKKSHCKVDNLLFRLTYKWTTILLFVSAILIGAKLFLGKPISCESSESETGFTATSVELTCWYSGMNAWKGGYRSGYEEESDEDDVKNIQLSSYSWACPILIFQAIALFIPWYLWNQLGRRDIEWITLGLQRISIGDLSFRRQTIEAAAKHISQNKTPNSIFFKFWICEILNLVTLVKQVLSWNHFLGGKLFSTLIDQNETAKLFPKVTPCYWTKMGRSGTQQKYASTCFLPVNDLLEKIYIVVLCWFLTLIFLSICQIAFRLIQLIFPILRRFLLRHEMGLGNASHIDLRSISLGDWFALMHVSQNVPKCILVELIQGLHKGNNFNGPDE